MLRVYWSSRCLLLLGGVGAESILQLYVLLMARTASFFLCGEIEISVVKHDTFFLLFGILNISQAMRRPVILYGIH